MSHPSLLDEPTDENLVIGFRKGSAADFDLLYSRYQLPLQLFFARRTGDQELSLDLTQSTFEEMLRSLSKYDTTRRFAPWIYWYRGECAKAIRA